MSNRRFFIKGALATAGVAALQHKSFAIPATPSKSGKLKLAVISDLHHQQFGQQEEKRLEKFMDKVIEVNPDFIIQCGDFCRHTGAEGIMNQWNRFKGPKYHVLGNHDMDVNSKEQIMKLWGMPARYYSFDLKGYHFVIVDRNLYRKKDGTLAHYDTSNWPSASEDRSYSDKEQLDWLMDDLRGTQLPTIVFMHQPVFLTDFPGEIGNAKDILKIFDEVNLAATRNKSSGKVSAVFMGHDHDDRYGVRNNVHYFMLNSATYAYSGGAYFYKEPLFAFVELDPGGQLNILGTQTRYTGAVPDGIVARFPASISGRSVFLNPSNKTS